MCASASWRCNRTSCISAACMCGIRCLCWRCAGAGWRSCTRCTTWIPIPDVAHGSLIRLWNRGVIAWADGLIVHGMLSRASAAAGRSPATVLATPLLHSFLAAEDHARLDERMPEATFAPWALLFGRFERYKGLDVLLNAQRSACATGTTLAWCLRVAAILAQLWPHALPPA